MMDRALKERILGAAVLVVVAVLIVPVFLDGPPGEEEIVSERVSLPGQAEQKVQTVVLNRDRSEPVPAATSNGEEAAAAAAQPSESTAQKQQPTVVPAAAKKQPAQATPQAASRSATGMWAVQLGSFSTQQNAERLAADLRRKGFAAFLSQLATDSGQLHRVRIGPQKDRESAVAMAERLGEAGHKGQVVPHP